MKKKSLLAAGAQLSLLTLVSRILGLVREATKAAFLGTSALADAFGIAFMIPNLFRRLFAENSISVAFIPTFKAYLENSNTPEGRQETQDFVNATCTLITFLTAVVVILGICLAPLIIPLFYTDGDASVLQETTLLTRIMFPYLLVISVAAFFQGILNGLKIFAPSGFTPILFNIIVIAATHLLSPFTANPARAMAIGVMVGGFVQAAFQLPFVLKGGWKVSLTSIKKVLSNPGTRKVVSLVGPTVIGMAAYQLNDVVSTSLAGHAGTGIVSSLQYSLRLQELILGIFAVSIGTVILPDMAGLAKRQEWDEFSEMLTQSVKIIALITIPITFFSLITGENIISLVYKSKSFDQNSVALTLEAFTFHIAGLFFIAVNRVISPAFYAQGNTRSPATAGIMGFAVNILLALVLVGSMQGGGIALALTLAGLANTVFLLLFLARTRRFGMGPIVKGMIFYSIKMVVLSVIASVPLLLLKDRIFSLFTLDNRILQEGLPLILSALLFALVGVLLLIVTRDSLVKSIAQKIRRRI